ncbi:MAG: glycosyltransferase family 2 protein [Desulfovibrio sp.]|uniref:glycosyltransferase family 2 protein n=1 Tax=Desulfovibrio sp. 7SRBS1 TaxID=3378064 RepID=UPI003B407EB6
MSRYSANAYFKSAQVVLGGEAASDRPPLQCLQLGMELLLAAHLEAPFDGRLAQVILGLDQRLSMVPAPLREGLMFLSAIWKARENQGEDKYLRRLEEKGQVDRILEYALSRREKAPEDVFWLDVLWRHRRGCDEWRRWEDAFTATSTCPGFLLERARAEAVCARGEHKDEAAIFQSLAAVYGEYVDVRLGCALQRAGERDEAVRAWSRGLEAFPWNGFMALRLFDVLTGRADEVVRTDAPCAVLLYSYRKPELLDATLRSLHESDLGNARLLVLDNGSGDTTPDIVDGWVERFGADRMRKMVMPVNIGAPAARNWLIQEVAGMNCDDVVFMDDDVSLSPDWLGRLRAAQTNYPDASVWGCKVVDHDAPYRMQSVDYTFDANGMENLQVYADHLFTIDDGTYDYMRPCTSVTGCVHLFRAQELQANGGFDIRYSPSQYDDVDRDLRLVLRGGHAVYTGHMAVRHKRSSGSQAQLGRAARGSAEGNLIKLNSRFDAKEVQKINSAIHALREGDVQSKFEWLSRRLKKSR